MEAIQKAAEPSVPESVAKAILVWFNAPHALVIEDMAALHAWFPGMHPDLPKFGVSPHGR